VRMSANTIKMTAKVSWGVRRMGLAVPVFAQHFFYGGEFGRTIRGHAVREFLVYLHDSLEESAPHCEFVLGGWSLQRTEGISGTRFGLAV